MRIRAGLLKTGCVFLLAMCLGIVVLSRCNLSTSSRSDTFYLSLLQSAYREVSDRYVDQPDHAKLRQSMLTGMLSALDPHSEYLPPEPFKEMEVQMSGSFGGVGIELGVREGKLTVISPLEDTPAFRAGIHAGDHIFKIDASLTRGMGIMEAVKRMRGAKGTAVTLGIIRNGSLQPLRFHLIRDQIKIKSVRSRMLSPGYGLVRIAQFQEQTGVEFRQALQDLHRASGGALHGLVLDLRFNPGGLLDAAFQTANCFIGDDPGRSLIVSLRGRTADTVQDFHATLGEKEPRYPIVVLINSGSASASEIVAGALQDQGRAIIMGTPSFGKGSVQTVLPIKDGGALKLTTALYYTPSGRSIQAKGIIPDIEVGIAGPLPGNGLNVESQVRERDLDNRLAPADKQEPTIKQHTAGHASRTPGKSGGDYQVQRALELLQSLETVKQQGLTGVPSTVHR